MTATVPAVPEPATDVREREPADPPARQGCRTGRLALLGVLAAAGGAVAALALAGAADAAPLHTAAATAAGQAGTLAGGAGRHVAVLAAEGEAAGADAELRKEAALAGYLSYGVMAMTVVWGIALATSWAKRIVRHGAVYNGHLTLAITALAFGVIHALSYIFQSQEHFSIVKTFVPFVQGGEIEVALGIVGLELMIGASFAVTLTHTLNYRRFRKAHIGGTYVGAVLSWLHVLSTSPEARGPGLVGITVAAAALTCIILGVIRLLPPSRADRARIALEPVELEAAGR
jgi:methionine sulfoxide reductase heme-binding subunit